MYWDRIYLRCHPNSHYRVLSRVQKYTCAITGTPVSPNLLGSVRPPKSIHYFIAAELTPSSTLCERNIYSYYSPSAVCILYLYDTTEQLFCQAFY